MRRPDLRALIGPLVLLSAFCGCSRRDSTPATDASRVTHKKAIAAAANDRLVLQYLVKDAELVAKRIPTLRRETRGQVIGDTSVIWFAYYAGDSLLALDETRRVRRSSEENARYLFKGTALRYVTLDRVERDGAIPVRLRLAFGYDSLGRLSATSKNLNDAAAPLDTATDIERVARRARDLRVVVLASAPKRQAR
jgi:hypothetical protein